MLELNDQYPLAKFGSGCVISVSTGLEALALNNATGFREDRHIRSQMEVIEGLPVDAFQPENAHLAVESRLYRHEPIDLGMNQKGETRVRLESVIVSKQNGSK